jgi:hypothetical protein
MKRFVIRLLAFLMLMLIVDRGVGLGMRYMQEHAKGGYIGHHNKIINSNEDILIFGSSRAIHHYNPQIIEDSLGMSCYNCGQDGNGIILFYGWWQLMKEKHTPKLVIYDVNPGFDLLLGESNQKYLGWLRSEYEDKDIKQIFEEVDFTEKYKMQSMMYRYNSKFLQNIVDYVHPIFKIKSDGFLPLKGEMNEMKIKKMQKESKQPKIDSLKLELIEKLVVDIKKHNSRVIFVASPVWYGKENSQFDALYNICGEYGISFYNYSNSLKYVRNNYYFKDGSHLNARGADEFTKDIVMKIRLSDN